MAERVVDLVCERLGRATSPPCRTGRGAAAGRRAGATRRGRRWRAGCPSCGADGAERLRPPATAPAAKRILPRVARDPAAGEAVARPARRAARRGRARARRGDGAHARRPPRTPHPVACSFDRRQGLERRRGGGGDRRAAARLGRRADGGRDRRLPPPGGEPEELRMSEIGDALAPRAGRRPRRRRRGRARRAPASTTGSWRTCARARAGSAPGRRASCGRAAPPRWRPRCALAQRHGVAVVPYGGGSGVLGGAVPPAGSLVVDLRAHGPAARAQRDGAAGARPGRA